ncbi:7793_t:CDS:2 [Cetraspora pellucida]|uniref:7793_t:CDS:1 n=1 Tax=Cetraspora pellucida TaxID=1433469 RepID=A0ACA9MFN2_9GLOM|nr:7793_t:CDS:2 [Cetraspora pellucida]
MNKKETCSSCKHSLLLEDFIYNKKLYKTCASCLTKKSNKKVEKQLLLNNNEFEGQLENEIEKISFANIIEYISNKIANLEENSSISFNLCIELDDNMLMNASNDTKLLVKLIVDEIEEGDEYIWIKFYLACSQCRELECKYKESNRKRMIRFDCHRKLIISIDIVMKEAKIKLSHNIQHERPVDVTTFEEIKHEDPFISTHCFLDDSNNSSEFCYDIHCDATYKTAKGQFELYGIISSFYSAGFPLAYLMLNTTNALDNAQMGL